MEAKALRAQALLRDQNPGWANNNISSLSGGGANDNEVENERVAKETYDMLNDLLLNNKE